ncbi:MULTISPECIES: aspartate aminotransferase family protein [unclassified Bacillus (in: firmicutes)]|uniref:aminotransferase family protein n=1 Tax=unclassified Bacillus (in: firmicutes) TaxID=185979 RepID=UPI001BE5B53C|nr:MULTISPECIES: aspartate aminotransferase family protein [unclassified Bacillus (in: firmicutes)]MBT2618889.1 aspartate aminotransferase family protein [Bacillus sp. ISL-78]MBT2627865.1 aspartate aminotransferase family protein [Bacillus sp. ISL-101]
MNQSKLSQKNNNELLAAELSALDRKHLLHPSTNPKTQAQFGPKIIFTGGEGIHLHDMKGKTYIDGVSTLWNVNLGHGNKELADASYQQMRDIAYSTTFYGYATDPTVRLAAKIASLTPGDLNTVFFTSGGSESNDTVFKLSRFYWQLQGYTEKRKIISLKRGYHGVTVSAQRATGIDVYREFSGSTDPDIVNAKAHLTDCELGNKSHPEYEGCIRSIIEKEGKDKIAAVILEPIQGAGGVHLPPEGYLKAVRDLCDEFDIHLIADEVICGFGRTGKMFGVDHWDIVPDFMSIAKGITSGYAQLGGVVMREKIRDAITEYDGMLAHGFTYSGHPTACAVGLKNIEILERDGLVENASLMGQELERGIRYLEDKYHFFAKGRVKGLLAGFDLMADPDTDTPFNDTVKASVTLVDECYQRGLLIRPFDFEPGMNIVAIAPPLIINKDELERIISIVDDSLTAFSKKI